MAGPRNPQTALPIRERPGIEPDREIIGEFDDPPHNDDEIEDDPPRIQHDWDQESTVIDVEIVADEYTDAPMTIAPYTHTGRPRFFALR